MTLRALIAVILSVLLVVLTTVEAQAFAQAAAAPMAQAQQEDDDILDDIRNARDDIRRARVEARQQYFGHDYDQKMVDLIKADNADDFDDIRRQALKSGIASGFWKAVGRALLGAELIDHARKGEWEKVLEVALANALPWALDTAFAIRYGVIAAQICAFAAIAAPACVPIALIIMALAKSKAAENLVEWARRRYCAGREDSWYCPAGRARAGQAPINPVDQGETGSGRSETAPSTAVKSAQAGGGRPPSRVSVGSGTINATAKSVVTTARGGASAQTDIGVREGGGGRLSVSAGDVVTNASGADASTVIGSGTGTVSAGDVYNQGGSLTIGAGGIARDGRTCVEIYLRTCIVHVYYRRKSDPCAPGYWTQLRKCLLPADTRHTIGNR